MKTEIPEFEPQTMGNMREYEPTIVLYYKRFEELAETFFPRVEAAGLLSYTTIKKDPELEGAVMLLAPKQLMAQWLQIDACTHAERNLHEAIVKLLQAPGEGELIAPWYDLLMSAPPLPEINQAPYITAV